MSIRIIDNNMERLIEDGNMQGPPKMKKKSSFGHLFEDGNMQGSPRMKKKSSQFVIEVENMPPKMKKKSSFGHLFEDENMQGSPRMKKASSLRRLIEVENSQASPRMLKKKSSLGYENMPPKMKKKTSFGHLIEDENTQGSPRMKKKIEKKSKSTNKVTTSIDESLFVNLSASAKASQKYGACVNIFTSEELKGSGCKLYVQGGAFAALTSDGELINVVRHADYSTIENVQAVMMAAIQNGADYLECFDTILIPLYMQWGFVPVAKARWNEQYKPFDWNKNVFRKYKNGEPDYVYMVWAGKDRNAPFMKERPTYDPKSINYVSSEKADQLQLRALNRLLRKQGLPERSQALNKICGSDALEAREKPMDFTNEMFIQMCQSPSLAA